MGGAGSHSKSPGGALTTWCFQLLTDGFSWREALHTCPAWSVSQNLRMVLALVWQVKALQAVMTIVAWRSGGRPRPGAAGATGLGYEDRMKPLGCWGAVGVAAGRRGGGWVGWGAAPSPRAPGQAPGAVCRPLCPGRPRSCPRTGGTCGLNTGSLRTKDRSAGSSFRLPRVECPCPTACPFSTRLDGAARPQLSPEHKVLSAAGLIAVHEAARPPWSSYEGGRERLPTLTQWQGQGQALAPQPPKAAESWTHRRLLSSPAMVLFAPL